MKKKLMIGLLVASMLFGTGVQALADPLTTAQQQDLDNRKNQISAAEQKYAELQNKADELNIEIQKLVLAVQENESNISSVNKDIEALNVQIEDNKKEFEKKEELFKTRIKFLYENGGQANYITVLFSANSIGDFISKAQAIGKILSLDKQILEELDEKKKEYDVSVARLDTKKTELENLNSLNKSKLSDLNQKKDEQLVYIQKAKEEYSKLSSDLITTERNLYKPFENIINNTSSSINDLNNSISALNSLKSTVTNSDVKNEINNLLAKANTSINKKKAEIEANKQTNTQTSPTNNQAQKPSNNTNTNPSSNAPVSASASKILEIAYSKLGADYVWGATGPDVFDCSGFTQYVYRQAGIYISRTTYTQINDGVAVSYSNLQPGDLVLTSAGHIGIYVGNGQMIHAPQTGDVVKVSKIWSFYAARRIL
ncbi:NlpC/P60 family protein [Clostridium intestinale]|uniref:Cell wall-associated hydrolase, NlpC family n=1 Tax=Clostridium intestinale DSM 6191 TaxID=1121320 RepID=A0A1M5UDF0_9CLOT|nr:NlpC/P60 family protein [Clostridium intestinale]SHH60989.1 Cell wall-associated hydrolase, NlpC family [Clostridium intestinale DSM 6191]